MRLLEAIIDANHRALSGDKSAGLRPAEHTASLPLVALTCIDPRLNPLMPEVLGIPEDQFIWLRNAGNIIFDSKSSMTRTLALACAIKGGREIAIIGHSDCKVRQTSVMQLTDRFKALGIERTSLPDNLTEFFGLFASERQNVIRGVEFVRNSPLIGPKVPVHGLVVDIETGNLDWVVNGYQALETVGARMIPQPVKSTAMDQIGTYTPFSLGESKIAEPQIGNVVTHSATPVPGVDPAPVAASAERQERMPERAETKQPKFRIDPSAHYKIMDAARKVLGPISGQDLERWVTEGRVDLNTLAQKLGYKEWRPLATLIEKEELPSIPIPPPVAAALRFGIDKALKKERK
jgi:carbonic anhydrase